MAGEVDEVATPEEARAILEELHRVTSAAAPLEHCPFSLTPPKAPKRKPAVQPELFSRS